MRCAVAALKRAAPRDEQRNVVDAVLQIQSRVGIGIGLPGVKMRRYGKAGVSGDEFKQRVFDRS